MGSALKAYVADDMIWYVENPKESTKKLSELIDVFCRVAGYKISVQKSIVFLCIYNKKSENEIKETISFIIASRIIKYLGKSLRKAQNFCILKNINTVKIN